MSNDRYSDAFRRPSLYMQIVKKAIKDERLPERFTAEEFKALCDRMRAEKKLEGEVSSYIGDDLDEEALNDLWAAFADGTRSTMSGWWADKPHQIAYRLLLRLTRAEVRNAELIGLLGSLECAGEHTPEYDYGCPSCRMGSWDHDEPRHAADCKLNRALRGPE